MPLPFLRRTLGAAAIFALAAAAPASAAPGVFASSIVFGQAAALEGPAEALGQGMRAGLLAAFAEANAAGGVNGRTLELKSIDDGYEPEQSIRATRTLIDQDQVFALVGPVGTPTSSATQPIATAAGVPFIGPFTGAAFLRDPAFTNVVNVRASYDQETEAWIKHLTEDLGYRRIAILYQDDSFGRAGLSGVEKAMSRRGIELVAEGTYQRNTTAVREALLRIRRAEPEAVVTVGAYKAIAEFIRLAKRVGMESTFVSISFVGPEALAAELGADGDGVVVTQVVPLATNAAIPVVAAYQAALTAHVPDASFGSVSLEGYLVGRLVTAALAAIEGEPTREALLEAMHRHQFDFGGMTLDYDHGDNQGSDQVFLTVIQPDGSFKTVTRLGEAS